MFSDSLTIEVDNEDNSDTEPEPLAEPECTYKTNDQMNAESWLLVCSTIACAAAGISKFNSTLYQPDTVEGHGSHFIHNTKLRICSNFELIFNDISLLV